MMHKRIGSETYSLILEESQLEHWRTEEDIIIHPWNWDDMSSRCEWCDV